MDTGYAGTIGSTNLDKLLGKSFFARHDLLPRKIIQEGLHSWPAPDYTVLGGGGAVTRSKTWMFGTVGGIAGWNFGADKTRALFIATGMWTGPFRQVLSINDAQPNTTEFAGANSFGFRVENFSFLMDVGRTSSASGFASGFGWTQLALLQAATFQPANYRTYGMALYVDVSGSGVVKAFVRRHQHGGQWIEVASAVSAHLSKVRCATWYFSPQDPRNSIFGPMGIYAD